MTSLPRFEQTFATALPELVAPAAAAQFPDAQLIAWNEELARELGFAAPVGEQIGLFVGRADLLPGASVAMAYAGHQFGAFVPRLGDGRALLVGEVRFRDSRRVDLHLKGSGPTPFSRGGDGYAALGPMLREYLVSEAMHALGIATSRSLAVTATGMGVRREIMLPGAVLARVAASHIRVGTFQYASSDAGLLRWLADYSIDRHYPETRGDYVAFFQSVIAAQARLVASWMGAGFVHGVMNTDNTTISGESIDYGPCAFLDSYDPGAVFSSIDHRGRYAYQNQPGIAEWNLARFGESLLTLIDVDAAQEALASFSPLYRAAHSRVFSTKLGLRSDHDHTPLIEGFLELLASEQLDFTNSFRALSEGEAPSDSPAMTTWVNAWAALDPDLEQMRSVNPIYIPRNLLLQNALNNAEDGNLADFTQLLSLTSSPFERRPGTEEFLRGAPGGFQTFCGT